MPPPAFGVAIPSYGPFSDGSTLTPIAQAAEDLGYADAWFADHVVIPGYAAEISGTSWLEPLACCLVGLGATRTLRFGTDVLVAPYRNPVLVAKMAASADRLSGGRLTLGLGTGYIHGEFEALGAPDYARRGQVTDEYIQVLRCLFESSGACSFAGEFVQFDDAAPLGRWQPEPRPAASCRPRRWLASSLPDPRSLPGGSGPHRLPSRTGNRWVHIFLQLPWNPGSRSRRTPTGNRRL